MVRKCEKINSFPLISSGDLADGFNLVIEQQELIERPGSVIRLPSTSPEDVIEVTGMKRSLDSSKSVNLLAMLAFSDLLTWKAYSAYENDNADKALDSFQSILRLGHQLTASSNIFNYIIGVSISTRRPVLLNEIIIVPHLAIM